MNRETCAHELRSVTKLYQAVRRKGPAMSGHKGMTVNQSRDKCVIETNDYKLAGYIKQQVWAKDKCAYATSVHKILEQK